MIRFVQFILAALLIVASIPPAVAFNWEWRTKLEPEKRVPVCDDPSVHRNIKHRFAWADREYYRGIEKIEVIDRVRQLALVAHRPSPLVRRYCRARVTMSDQHTRTMYYMIEEDAGFVGFTSDVEFCIRGLDRWRVYDAHCRTVRP